MSERKISAEEQRELRNAAKEKLNRLMRIQSDTEMVELLDRFKNTYNVCETVYKVLLKEHQNLKGKINKNSYMKVDMRQVPHALAFAGYKFDKSLLNELFGANSQKGMTVKKLRDAVTHGIDEKAVKEITEREKELFGYMHTFLTVIESFDEEA